jgi:hypothetical protein
MSAATITLLGDPGERDRVFVTSWPMRALPTESACAYENARQALREARGAEPLEKRWALRAFERWRRRARALRKAGR